MTLTDRHAAVVQAIGASLACELEKVQENNKSGKILVTLNCRDGVVLEAEVTTTKKLAIAR